MWPTGDSAAAASVTETTLVLAGHGPEEVRRATGVAKTASVGSLVWSDADLAAAQSVVQRHANNKIDKVSSSLRIPPTPVDQLKPLRAKTVAAELFADKYPRGKRYLTEGWPGDERFWDCPDSTFVAMLEPLVRYWANDDENTTNSSDIPPPPPAPSHTIVPLCPKRLPEAQRHHPQLAGGWCTPSFNALSYAIYEGDGDGAYYRRGLRAAQAGFLGATRGHLHARGRRAGAGLRWSLCE